MSTIQPIGHRPATADNPAELLFDPDEASQNLIQAQPLSDPHRWEIAAAVLESGARLWLPIVEVGCYTAASTEIVETVE